MNKFLATALLLIWQPLLAAPPPDQYSRVLLLMGTAENFSSGMAVGLGYGSYLPQVLPYFSVEAEVAKNFSHMEGDDGNGNTVKRSWARGALYAALIYPVDPRFQIKGRIGSYLGVYRDRGGAATGSDIDSGMETGIGALVHYRSGQDIALEYTTNTLNDFTQVILGLQIAF